MRTNLAKTDVLKAIKTLSAVYSPPKGSDIEEMAAIWFGVFDKAGVTFNELDLAVQECLASDSPYWPKPGKILGYARDYRKEHGRAKSTGLQGQYDDWYKTGMYGPCPVCGLAMDRDVTGQRLRPMHDDAQHRRAGIAYAGVSA